jgi:hypothetical protein
MIGEEETRQDLKSSRGNTYRPVTAVTYFSPDRSQNNSLPPHSNCIDVPRPYYTCIKPMHLFSSIPLVLPRSIDNTRRKRKLYKQPLLHMLPPSQCSIHDNSQILH